MQTSADVGKGRLGFFMYSDNTVLKTSPKNQEHIFISCEFSNSIIHNT